MRIACWIAVATNTHSEYVILIFSPQQQWLHERTPLLRYTHIVGLTVILKQWDELHRRINRGVQKVRTGLV